MTSLPMNVTTLGDQGWTPDTSGFGARLALVRQYMGWGNVQEAAEECGVPVGTWRSWERDNRQPREYMAACQKIATRSGCDLSWLVGVTTTREQTTERSA